MFLSLVTLCSCNKYTDVQYTSTRRYNFNETSPSIETVATGRRVDEQLSIMYER